MIIGIDARYAFRPNPRGIGNYIRQFLGEYVKQPAGHRYILYLDRHCVPPSPDEFPPDLFRVRTLPHDPMVVWEQVGLPLAARADGVDLLHCPANICPIMAPVPVVVTVHDVIEWHRRDFGNSDLALRHRVSRAYRMPVMALGARKAAKVLTVSEFSRQDIAAQLHIAADKIHVTHLGPSSALQNVMLPEGGLSSESPYLLALGALDRRKNTAQLIQVFGKLKATARLPRDLRLVVVGLEQPDAFRTMSGTNVEVLPFVTDAQLAALYKQSIGLIVPSLYEGFGIPLLDAMALGVPVVCSRTTSLPEVAGEAAVYFDPTSEADMGRQIERFALDADLRSRLVNQGRERAKSFSWSRLAAINCEVYALSTRGE